MFVASSESSTAHKSRVAPAAASHNLFSPHLLSPPCALVASGSWAKRLRIPVEVRAFPPDLDQGSSVAARAACTP